MYRKLCKSKIHGVIVTKKNIEYNGSIGIDVKLLNESGIIPNEMVLVVNTNTGARFETYTIPEKSGSGTVSLRGGAARLGETGDKLIIISYGYFEDIEIKSFKPKIIFINGKNRIVKNK